MNEILKARHDALAQALMTTMKKIFATNKLDFSIMEQEFIKQGYREDQLSGVEKILIFRLDYMGDFILSTPAIREIRANYPNAFITLLVNKAVYPMAEFCPYVNEVIPIEIDYSKLIYSSDFQPLLILAADIATKYLWKRNYTLSICLRNGIGLIDLFINYLSGAKERVGNILNGSAAYEGNPELTKKDIANYFLTNAVVQPKYVLHFCAQNLYLLKAVGLHIRQTDLELWYDAEDLYTARKLLENFAPNRLKIVTGIGATMPARKYPVEKYLIAFKKIISKGASIIILGGPDEVDDAKFLQDNLPVEFVKNFVSLKIGWRTSAAITSLCDIYIGNDTGLAHIAAAEHLHVIRTVPESDEYEKNLKAYLLKINFGTKLEHSIYYMNSFPWQSNVIDIRPKYSLGDCKNKLSYFGCGADKPHCITQIEPSEIVDAYETFAKLIKNSGIKRTSCPPIIRNIDPLPKLYSTLINP